MKLKQLSKLKVRGNGKDFHNCFLENKQNLSSVVYFSSIKSRAETIKQSRGESAKFSFLYVYDLTFFLSLSLSLET